MLQDGQNSRGDGIEVVLDEVNSSLHKSVGVKCRACAHVAHSICGKVAFWEDRERSDVVTSRFVIPGIKGLCLIY